MASDQPSPAVRVAGLPPGVEPGPLGRRFVARLVDVVVPALLTAVGTVVFRSTGGSVLGLVVYAVCLLAVVAWGLLVWWMFAQRAAGPGMRLMGLQLVGLADGRPIGAWRFLLRALILWALSLTVVGLVLMIVFLVLQPRRQGWHDLAVNSVVIKERALAPSPARAQIAQPASAGSSPTPASVASAPSANPVQAAPATYQASAPTPPAPAPLAPPAGYPGGQGGATPMQPYPPQPAQPYPPQPYPPQPGPAQPYPPQPAQPYPAQPVQPYPPQPGPQQPYPPQPAQPSTDQPRPPTSPSPVQPIPAAAPPSGPPPVAAAVPAPVPVPRPATGSGPATPSPAPTGTPAPTKPPSAEPGWLAVLDDGRQVPITGLVLLGRNPQPRPGEETAQLIKLADTSRTVSKSHLEIGVNPAGMYVLDRGSTNGSTVTNVSGVSKRCPPGDVVQVFEGSIVSFGDHWLEVRRG